MKTLLILVAMTSLASADPKLDSLVGTWKGTGSLTLKGQATKVTLTYDCTHAGAGVMCETHAQLAKDKTLDERHLFGHDDATGTYHLFSVNDWGEAYDHAAKWTDPAKASFEYVNGAAHEVYAIAVGKDTLTVHATF